MTCSQACIELVFEGGASRSVKSQAKTVTRSSKGPRVFDDELQKNEEDAMLSHHHLMPQSCHDEHDELEEHKSPALSLAQAYARAIRAELALLAPEARQRFCQSWLERLTPSHPAYEMRLELMGQMNKELV